MLFSPLCLARAVAVFVIAVTKAGSPFFILRVIFVVCSYGFQLCVLICMMKVAHYTEIASAAEINDRTMLNLRKLERKQQRFLGYAFGLLFVYAAGWEVIRMREYQVPLIVLDALAFVVIVGFWLKWLV